MLRAVTSDLSWYMKLRITWRKSITNVYVLCRDASTNIRRSSELISTFCCRPFERSRDLDERRRIRDRWGQMIDSTTNKTSPNRLRIGTPSFFKFQVIPDRRFSSKHDGSTTQFLSRCLLHAFGSSVFKSNTSQTSSAITRSAGSRHSFRSDKNACADSLLENYVRSRPRLSSDDFISCIGRALASIVVVRGAAQDSLDALLLILLLHTLSRNSVDEYCCVKCIKWFLFFQRT